MKIQSVHARRYRSISSTSLPNCGGLNVLIGKNNAGKSNLLAAVETVIRHLKRGVISNEMQAERPQDEFTDRDTKLPFQLGIEFELSKEIAVQLCEKLKVESPHLERSIEQLRSQPSISFIVAGGVSEGNPFLFLQEIAAGQIDATRDGLGVTGIKLLSVPHATAAELYQIQKEVTDCESDAETLGNSVRDRRLEYLFEEPRQRGRLQYLFTDRVHLSSAQVYRRVETLFQTAKDQSQFTTGINELIAELKAKINGLRAQETTTPLKAFAGDFKVPPAYALWLMKEYGSIDLLHLRENKRAIGRDEAEQLLNLKVRRGGPERLHVIQSTVRSLLGVNVDAFQSERIRGDRERTAEMDVDEFLVEANGAGIREALRLILDLELKEPSLALIEEPEVHLHPGLENAVHAYLREKSQTMQFFVTTHSTNFVDSISFQNVYLVSRDAQKKTVCEPVIAGDEVAKIPAELGLRLSTVFMFDRLVFVEGPSDEAVFRELAIKFQVDLAQANIGFVQMGGIRNFAHFAAEGILNLLSRRRIKLWFITDRDERDDDEVLAMKKKLGDRAELYVLNKREIENYLLDAQAVCSLLQEKSRQAGTKQLPTEQDVKANIEELVQTLRDEVVRLRVEKRMLGPVFLHTRESKGSIEERIETGLAELDSRRARLAKEQERIAKEVADIWQTRAGEIVPASVVLQKVAAKYGLSFAKDRGDSARLARLITRAALDNELHTLMSRIVS